MIDFCKKMYKKYEEMIVYLIGGVLSTIVNWIAYVLCSRVFIPESKYNYLISTAIAFIVALVFSYFINKWMVFKSNDYSLPVVLKEFTLFSAGRVTSLFMEMGMMYALVDWCHMNDLIAKFICLFFVMVANYLFSKLLVFKEKA